MTYIIILSENNLRTAVEREQRLRSLYLAHTYCSKLKSIIEF
jgi:hypothetical protein